ncbi:uncharacterized protein LOC122071865 [Macadamia integrifolia]|uniref:uncharacterized protein LOC122071865 n=1 Tax=Macadamia integrifolia TaxID=60698 RepID=UPI001C4E71B1|nr:uncharacterized protein LOC122071865 [Macadamia integrifolia]
MTTPLKLLLPLPLNTIFFSSDFPPKPSKFFSHHSNFSSKSSHPFKSSPISSSSSFTRWVRVNRDPQYLRCSKWFCGYSMKDQDMGSCMSEGENMVSMFGSDDDIGTQVPTQVQSLVEGPGSGPLLVSEFKPAPDVDYLQELLAIQQQGPRSIGFFGTRNMGFMHQELIEILSYAMVITKNHIYTSGASGTNAAVIRGALRAEKSELLTVILPQSLKMQPPESQELLSKVKNVIEKPHNDHLPLIEASRLCNMDIISRVQQVICFAFHDSRLLMETCQEAKNLRKIVTLFYLD